MRIIPVIVIASYAPKKTYSSVQVDSPPSWANASPEGDGAHCDVTFLISSLLEPVIHHHYIAGMPQRRGHA
jgi:hypothetical protein